MSYTHSIGILSSLHILLSPHTVLVGGAAYKYKFYKHKIWRKFILYTHTEPEFVNLLRNPGFIPSLTGWYNNPRLAESIPGLLKRLQIRAQACVQHACMQKRFIGNIHDKCRGALYITLTFHISIGHLKTLGPAGAGSEAAISP
jgi:hypothetical protein